MNVPCAHCKNPIEVESVADGQEIQCPACDSSFRLQGEPTTIWQRDGQRELGRFKLLQVVGEGAFGTVYKALDVELDRTVAIKVPRVSRLTGSDSDGDRFMREARAAAQLRHPCIVAVHEAGLIDGTPYLVSDFVAGITLADWTTAQRPTERQSAELVALLAEALQFAHEHGVVHRDIKPSNIMLEEIPASAIGMGSDSSKTTVPKVTLGTRTFRLKVMDFGLAKRDAGEITMTMEGQVLGTPAYMSPEQVRGDAHLVDGRSDIYSVGVILFSLLTGELPFRGTTRALLHQVIHEEPKSPRVLNDRIARDPETITLKCMQKEPVKRYASP